MSDYSEKKEMPEKQVSEYSEPDVFEPADISGSGVPEVTCEEYQYGVQFQPANPHITDKDNFTQREKRLKVSHRAKKIKARPDVSEGRYRSCNRANKFYP
ncbi:hypothetical protein [Methanosarcina siciliae]|uniref:hypothetical protein n=1 Tax=Methanosarcina siciliae TaxID=38027 RepID=UPI0026BDCAB6